MWINVYVTLHGTSSLVYQAVQALPAKRVERSQAAVQGIFGKATL